MRTFFDHNWDGAISRQEFFDGYALWALRENVDRHQLMGQKEFLLPSEDTEMLKLVEALCPPINELVAAQARVIEQALQLQ